MSKNSDYEKKSVRRCTKERKLMFSKDSTEKKIISKQSNIPSELSEPTSKQNNEENVNPKSVFIYISH